MTAPSAIQGVAPQQVYQTWNLTELSAAMEECRRSGRAVCDYGQFHGGLGHAPPRGYAQIVTPAGIVEHHVADMTVRVRAATRIGELQRELASQRQWLPIDGMDEAMTLGEIVAHNVYGPLRVGYGAMREMLLGLRFVDGEGRQITVGGRTVKNVAGYDVTRMMIGNLNTLGLITEVTLRTWALPEKWRYVELTGADLAGLCRKVTMLMTSDATPVYLEARQRVGEQATVVFGYAGEARACEAQVNALERWLREETIGVERRQVEGKPSRSREIGADAVVRVMVPPGRVGEAVERLEMPKGAILEVFSGHGMVQIRGNWVVKEAKKVDERVKEVVRRLGGGRVWVARPGDTEEIEPVEPEPGDWGMMRRIKRAMDPENVFNPTRMWRA